MGMLNSGFWVIIEWRQAAHNNSTCAVIVIDILITGLKTLNLRYSVSSELILIDKVGF